MSEYLTYILYNFEWLGRNIAPVRNVILYQQIAIRNEWRKQGFLTFLNKNIKWSIIETFVLLIQRKVWELVNLIIWRQSFAASCQWRHQGGHWGICPPPPPPSRRLCPHSPPPPVRRKSWSKSAIFGKFLDSCPLRIAFSPLMPQKFLVPLYHFTFNATGCNRKLFSFKRGLTKRCLCSHHEVTTSCSHEPTLNVLVSPKTKKAKIPSFLYTCETSEQNGLFLWTKIVTKEKTITITIFFYLLSINRNMTCWKKILNFYKSQYQSFWYNL